MERGGMMHCDENRERIVLMVYDELEEAAGRRLESHIASCADCAAALAEERRLAGLVTGALAEEPSEGLLRRCREHLGRALLKETATLPTARPVARAGVWRGLRLSPAWAAALVVLAFVAGRVFPAAGRGVTVRPSDTAAGAS